MVRSVEQMQKLLVRLRGITQVALISAQQRKKMLLLEEKNNVGVFDVLQKKYVFLATHDASFRDPPHEIVKKEKEKVIFPSQPFPEIPEAIIASPGWKVHEYLSKEFDIQEGESSL